MFVGVRDFVDSFDEGRSWVSTFRKAIPSTATVSGQWYDCSYAGGNPIANYYASSPLVADVLDPMKGIVVPQMVAGAKQWLHRWSAMSAAASATSVTNANQQLMLMDYLLYYPFVDMDAAGEDQVMGNTVALPRYSDGVGVQMMVVAQSITVGGGRFTITYTDSDDVQRTTTSMFCGAAGPSGAIVQAVLGTGGLVPFVPLKAGVRGVKRIDSCNFSVPNGGLCAIVLVRPLDEQWLREECRTTTTGTIESFGDVTEKEAISRRGGIVEIKSGAFLGILARGANGSLASSILTGTVETVWR